VADESEPDGDGAEEAAAVGSDNDDDGGSGSDDDDDGGSGSDEDALAEAARVLAGRDEEPHRVYSRLHGSGFSFPDTGQDGESFVTLRAARATAKAAQQAAAELQKPAAK